MSLLSPIDIKKRFQPFGYSDNPRVYSFKQVSEENVDAHFPYVRIGILPSVYDSEKWVMHDEDISFSRTLNHIDKNKGLNKILESIPYIKIREYTQETRLDLITSFVEYFKRGWNDAQSLKDISISEANVLFHLITHDLTSFDNPNLRKIFDDAAQEITSQFDDTFNFKYKDGKELEGYHEIFTIPYLMYYRLLSTKTSNYYILPYNNENLMEGNGQNGFETEFGWDSKGALSKLGIVGEFVAPNIQFTTTPIWRGVNGGEGRNIEFTVNLFNDEVYKAAHNFVMVNTLISQNLPVQYHFTQSPPSLYDIWIPGFDRLFMCSCKITVNNKGVMRRIPIITNNGFKENFISILNTFADNHTFQEEFLSQIRVPDIYEIKFQFKSLLPNTFNNFLYQFSTPMITYPDAEQKEFFQIDGVKKNWDNWIEERYKPVKSITNALKTLELDYNGNVVENEYMSEDDKNEQKSIYEYKKEKLNQLYKAEIETNGGVTVTTNAANGDPLRGITIETKTK